LFYFAGLVEIQQQARTRLNILKYH
jgi:hypothetical protein